MVTSSAQKFAYVDSKYILENIPDYKLAQEKLNKLSQEWQKEIEDKFAEIREMQEAYDAEKILLTDDMKQQRETDIARKKTLVKDLQKQRFGVDGDLFKKRQELVKPLQDQIYSAIKDIAGTTYAIVFDKANHSNILFANPKYDKSDDVLKRMGYTPGGSN